MEFPSSKTKQPDNLKRSSITPERKETSERRASFKVGANQTLGQTRAPTPHDAPPIDLQPDGIVGAALAEDPAELDLSEETIGSLQGGQVAELIETLRADKTRIEGIERCNLSGQLLSEKDIVSVAATLPGCRQLRMDGTDMTPNGLALLLKHLPANHKLSHLDLSGNKLGPASDGKVVDRLLLFIPRMFDEDATLNVKGNGFTPAQNDRLRGYNAAAKTGDPTFFLDPQFSKAEEMLIAFGKNAEKSLDLSKEPSARESDFIKQLAGFIRTSKKRCTIILPSHLPEMEDRHLLLETILMCQETSDVLLSFEQWGFAPIELGSRSAPDWKINRDAEKFLSEKQ